MGLLGSSDPVAQQEKLLHKEEKREEQSIKHAIKEISKAEKEQASAAKAEQHSHSTLEKAVKTEHKLGEKLNKITHEHDSAVADQNAAQNKLQSKEQAHQHATQVLQEKKAKLDQLQSNHHQSDAERQAKLDALHHTSAPAPAGTALDKEYAQQGYSSTGATQPPVGQAVPQQQGGLAGNYAAQDPAAGQAFVSQGQSGVGGPTQAGQRF